MYKFLKLTYRVIYNRPRKKILSKINKFGKQKHCNVCNNSFFNYIPYRGGAKDISCFLIELDMIGSDVENFSCPYCGAHDRTRHIFLFFEKLNFWKSFEHKRVLHISPEIHLYNKIQEINYEEYIKGDIDANRYENIKNMQRVDLTQINFPDNYFNIVMANHVLEHIPNYSLALNEIYRVLDKDGVAVLQTPYSNLLYHTIEDPNINTDELRLKYYGEKDHYRIFGLDFFESLKNAGFNLDVKKHTDYITKSETFKYGVNSKENLILIRK